MSLRDRLVELMKEKKKTIKDLATETDISEPTLKKLRTKDDCNPTLDVLIKISRALDVPINQLIQESDNSPIFYQDSDIVISDTTDDFIVVFTKNTFHFKNGAKAVFRKYKPGNNITKYIVYKNGKIMEKVDEKKSLFKNENQEIFSIEVKDIKGCILKELYEVNYV